MKTSSFAKLLACACVMLSGCSVFSPVASVSNVTYLVDTVPQVSVQRTHKVSIAVSEPATLSIYNTTDMAYSNYPYQIGYFVKSSWAATPGQMLQPLIVQTLQNTKHFTAVNSVMSSGQVDYTLSTQLLEFQQDFTSGRNIFRLRMRALLVRTMTGNVAASKEFEINVPASQNTPYGGVVAANQATRDMLIELARFCSSHT
jgi:cholesterol transport system auxiliary component